ncbi:Protein POLYCHOME [Camellia lanceoleosa]|uniref:Protein POLYCHOME n=1 Tax=Camellia lanceoleosa TaxID=1840588 RepID=A0ACC0FWT0_9ERIC|nr:Protein POLYCHOME [Camellia lanceoleosa]
MSHPIIIIKPPNPSIFKLKIDTMPESRDRLSRPDDITVLFARRRQSIGGIAILLDEPEEVGSGTPFRRGATAMTGTRGAMGSAATGGGGVGRENTPLGRVRRGRGRGGLGSVLPSWDPRTPLRDITAVARLKIDTMPESRDRLSRPDDITALFARRRQSIGGIAILLDEPEEVGSGTPFRWGATAMTGTRGAMGSTAIRGGGVSRENTPLGRVRRGRGRGGRGSVLPSWYPRTPLHDITAVVRAIEKRRVSLRETEGLQNESPISQDQNVLDPFVPTTNQNAGHPDCLTPQKKLLNLIDTVEKLVMEELKKMKSTLGAKKANREKKVQHLMSMR